MSTRERPSGPTIALLQGTLDLLILRTLRLGPAHGHAIVKAIESGSDDVLLVEQGSLYPALHRLIERGWITFDEGTSENNRRAKFYRLTAKGRKQLDIETSRWEKLCADRPHSPSRPSGVMSMWRKLLRVATAGGAEGRRRSPPSSAS